MPPSGDSAPLLAELARARQRIEELEAAGEPVIRGGETLLAAGETDGIPSAEGNPRNGAPRSPDGAGEGRTGRRRL
jgi:hypothetical protein